MKNNTLFVFNAEANKKRVNNNTLFVYDAEANNSLCTPLALRCFSVSVTSTLWI